MGDGKISLILDTLGLAQKANLLSTNGEINKIKQTTQVETNAVQKQMLLLLRSGADSLMAIPLSKVARIEEFQTKAIERAGKQEVVQYRDQIMPLVQLSRILDTTATEDHDRIQEKIQVVVYSRGQKSVGLVVDHVFDIVEESYSLQDQISRDGVDGSAVIQNKVTEVLDIEKIMHAALPQYFEDAVA